jgi:hypothetical protein
MFVRERFYFASRELQHFAFRNFRNRKNENLRLSVPKLDEQRASSNESGCSDNVTSGLAANANDPH